MLAWRASCGACRVFVCMGVVLWRDGVRGAWAFARYRDQQRVRGVCVGVRDRCGSLSCWFATPLCRDPDRCPQLYFEITFMCM